MDNVEHKREFLPTHNYGEIVYRDKTLGDDQIVSVNRSVTTMQAAHYSREQVPFDLTGELVPNSHVGRTRLTDCCKAYSSHFYRAPHWLDEGALHCDICKEPVNRGEGDGNEVLITCQDSCPIYADGSARARTHRIVLNPSTDNLHKRQITPEESRIISQYKQELYREVIPEEVLDESWR